LVTDFLTKYFTSILSYDFTANVEKDFDKIAEGKVSWTNMLKNFLHPISSNSRGNNQNVTTQQGRKKNLVMILKRVNLFL